MNSPILLFTYNRLSHTQRCVEALLKNNLASESELFIYADGKTLQLEVSVSELLETYHNDVNISIM